ncbi:hypothetical protein PV721_02500 [Streptomyces sp. MB09-01]|uniref:hypothetical protein n=1 Tax=Streptomyces sp. MB09-01 TaxID=3028666 RepID=UPI0029ACF737|nr:hypothetical protein [Streptomyces sp. MB09-01]MDX3533255.1 hypothetical protein [Streptomyces sp. MB09-01]
MAWPHTCGHGSFAEHMTAPQDTALAQRPRDLDPVSAAALPMTGGTALATLDWLEIKEGESPGAARPRPHRTSPRAPPGRARPAPAHAAPCPLVTQRPVAPRLVPPTNTRRRKWRASVESTGIRLTDEPAAT